MPHYLCTTCGIQFGGTAHPPIDCPICEDGRQFVNWQGQAWTTLDELRTGHRNVIKLEEPGLTGIGTDPPFAIGQRALLVQTSRGNLLWDCVSLIDPPTADAVRSLGGLSAIAISHPHYFASMIEWSRAFGGVPVYIHAADRQWVMREDPAVVYWNGETRPLLDGLTLIRCGGHFEGAAVLHWAAGAGGRGALLSGDTIQVVYDRRAVSFMYSYPNYIPLSPAAVRRIVTAVEPFPFDRIYGAFWDRIVASQAGAALRYSADRYVRAIEGTRAPTEAPS